MTQDVEKPCIANATTEPERHEEIEITPEMIAAAVPEFLAYAEYPGEDPEGAVREIFKAMVQASREPWRSDQRCLPSS
jgi:hypothetical protein